LFSLEASSKKAESPRRIQSGHFIRVLAARWLGADKLSTGRHFLLTAASLSAAGYEQDSTRPVIRLWNDDHHIGE
jgi:hypothetical protein